MTCNVCGRTVDFGLEVCEGCRQQQEDCAHDWARMDDSFDHEFGVEIIRYQRCLECGLECDDG